MSYVRLFHRILMATLAFSSGHACCSVTVVPSAEELQTLHARADKGDAEAQFFLGMIYGNGRGVQQNYAMARAWYEKAATQGYAMAQYNLGALYFYGHGVPQNDVKTYMLWTLATIIYRRLAEASSGILRQGRQSHES